MSTLIDIYSLWQNDLTFREAFKINPEQALREAGMHLSPSDTAKIRSLLLLKKEKLNSEPLDERINK